MALMFSDIFGVCMGQHKDFQLSDAGGITEEPYLNLRLIYSVVGESIQMLDTSMHRFVECSTSSLCAFIAEKEPLPLDSIVDPEHAEAAREHISNMVNSLVRGCIGVQGLKILSVIVILEIKLERNMMFLRERTMHMLQKEVYKAIGKNEKEVCAICIDEMRVGQDVVLTPCIHKFHEVCIRRWFEKKILCPLCRFDIEKSSREEYYHSLLNV